MPYFQAFQPVSVTVTFFMNSITFVMNHLFSYFDISICHSSNRTLSYRLFLTHGFNHGYILGGACYIHLTIGTYAQLLVYRKCYDFATLFLGKIDISLQPDYAFEASAYLGFSVEVFGIDAYVKG